MLFAGQGRQKMVSGILMIFWGAPSKILSFLRPCVLAVMKNEDRMKDKILEGAAQKKNSIYHFLRPSAGEKHKGYP